MAELVNQREVPKSDLRPIVRMIPVSAQARVSNWFAGHLHIDCLVHLCQRWSRFTGQNGGLAKVDSGFDYAANFSSFACVA